MDPYKFLQISHNPDGSLSRHSPVAITNTTPSQDPTSPFPSLSKDLPLNPSLNTSLRLYLPKSLISSSNKLPIILYIHGGCFVFISAANSIVHEFCSQRAARIPALTVSLEYRLAPEHRLPSAYDDAVEALLWLRGQALNPQAADPWMRDHADFSRCFVMGCSAGANVAYHLGLRSINLNIEPLKLRGLILNEPYFSGVERTESEARSEEDHILPLAANYLCWELSLPIGANRDHEYSNPVAEIGKAKGLPKCLVKGFVGDPLHDRQKVFVEALKKVGVRVVDVMEDQGFHGIELYEPSKAEALVNDCRSFIYSGDSSS